MLFYAGLFLCVCLVDLIVRCCCVEYCLSVSCLSLLHASGLSLVVLIDLSILLVHFFYCGFVLFVDCLVICLSCLVVLVHFPVIVFDLFVIFVAACLRLLWLADLAAFIFAACFSRAIRLNCLLALTFAACF